MVRAVAKKRMMQRDCTPLPPLLDLQEDWTPMSVTVWWAFPQRSLANDSSASTPIVSGLGNGSGAGLDPRGNGSASLAELP